MADEINSGSTPSGSGSSPSPSSAPSSPPNAGASSPAPSSTPSSGTPAAGEGPPSSKPDAGMFDGLGLDDFGDNMISVEVPPAPVAEAKAPEAPQTPLEESGQPKAPEPPKAEATPAPGQQPAPTPEASPAVEPKTIVEELATHRDAILGQLSKERFALSKEEEGNLELNAAQVIPSLMAKVYYESVTATLNHIQNLVPHLIEQHMKIKNAETEAETAFFGKFPSLSKEKHMADVVQFANAFKAANSKISREDLFAMIGAAVMAKHGLNAAPPQQNGTHIVASQPQPAPFRPASPGTSSRITPEPQGIFDGLGADYD